MIARLSVAPPFSPRAIQALKAASRRSRRLENCRNGSIEERESVITRLPSMPRSEAAFAAASTLRLGKAGEIRVAFEHQRVGALVGEHVLPELRAEHREPLGDLREPLLLLRVERRRPGGRRRDAGARARALCSAERPSVASRSFSASTRRKSASF